MENEKYECNDFVVSELLSELKNENQRKDTHIKHLQTTLLVAFIGCILAVLATVAGFLVYLNQYDFTSTGRYYTEQTASGVYAIIDSSGNVISSDLTADEANKLLEVLNGTSESKNSNTSNT